MSAEADGIMILGKASMLVKVMSRRYHLYQDLRIPLYII